jgi:hypothetical protein
MRSTTAGPQRDAIRALNPFARDKLESWKGVYSGNRYQESLTSEYERKRAILTDPNVSAEVKAATRDEAKAIARDESGLNNLAPQTLAGIAPELAQFEGQLAGQNYADTNENQRKIDLVTLENGFKSGLTGFLIREQQDMSGLTPWMNREIADQREMFTPSEMAGSFYSGMATEVQQLIAEKNTDQAVALTRGLVALSQQDIKTPAGVSFFDLKDGEGKSLTYKLSVLARSAFAASEQAGALEVKQLAGQYLDDYYEATSPEDKQLLTEQYRASLSTLDPERRLDGLLAGAKVESELNRATPLQIQNSAEMMIDITSRDLNTEDARGRVLEAIENGSITANQGAQRLAEIANGNPEGAVYEGIEGARRASVDDLSIEVADLIDVGDIDPDGDGPLSSVLASFGDKEKQKIIGNSLSKRVTIALEKKAKEARNNGDPWTTEMYVEQYREELSRQASVMRKELKKGEIQGTTRLERINNEYMALANNAKEGPLTVQSFAPATVKRWQKNNPGKEVTPKALLGEMSRLMGSLTDGKGQKIYPDAVKDLKELARQSRVDEDGFWEKRPKTNPLNFLLGAPQLRDEDAIEGVDQIPEQKGDSKEEKTSQKTEVDEKDPEQGFQKVLMQGLGALGNVVTLPAQAGTLEGKPGVLNANNSPEFAKVMARQEPFGIKTQPLPQLSSASPVRRVPIAISSRNHPIFVAIGIAEGTRTPSGGNTKAYYGHTDIGDGNWNRGTVSGGRNGGSPQQVDRQWMGTLTSVAATMAPVLQRLGLRPDSQGWNRVMFNILDLRVQAVPAAVRDFVGKLPQVMDQGLTIEAIAKARADSFFNPQTGRLEASGFGNNYSRLFADQRSRAGVYDYKRRF